MERCATASILLVMSDSACSNRKPPKHSGVRHLARLLLYPRLPSVDTCGWRIYDFGANKLGTTNFSLLTSGAFTALLE